MVPIVKREEEIARFWKEAHTFEQSVAKESPNGDYVFYDGPPFATGLPHYGHIVASVMKDVVPRYWTMNGYRVERRWGWDCHGLPVENIAEKELGFKDKRDIEQKGVASFNDFCKSLVLRYVAEWKATIDRIGRWVDMDNDYKTMDPAYMETIWWIFKKLWDDGLVYKGYKSMHLCPRCGTTLSNFEVTQNYQDINDLTAIAKFELVDEPGTFLLAWTTTPWTLIGNVALAVGGSIEYVRVRVPKGERIGKSGGTYQLSKDEIYILAKDRLEEILAGEYTTEPVRAADLIGKKYKPLFDYYQKPDSAHFENGWKVYEAPFVTTEEGTGIVHIAPAFGEEDMNLGKEKSLPFVQHIGEDGRFVPAVIEWVGELAKPKGNVQETDAKIVEWLRGRNLLFDAHAYTHSYPHCWRCDTPLLNYAAESWFVSVTKIKDKLLANNKKINWVPAHLRDGRFGKWLEQARDWAISRDRFWGTPLPVWECVSCHERTVVGSRDELEKLSGKRPDDLHKQYVDDIIIPCGKCSKDMRRIPEVFDCWFESGSMPYAELHYPFENKDKIEKGFPADFIAEGVDQTRGWFYTLSVLATALFDKPPSKTILVNGIVLAEDGTKMSKSKKNYPDPMEVINKYGSDALRFYMLDSAVMQADSLNFSERGVRETYNKVVNTLYNTVAFYKLFAKTDDNFAVASDHVMDRWIVAELHATIQATTEAMQTYDLARAVRPLLAFTQNLSTWYVRRSRTRFKSDDVRVEAVSTLNYVLRNLAALCAPFMPFVAEHIWKELTVEECESVHLASWPAYSPEMHVEEVIANMKRVRSIVETAHALRASTGIRVRQPLSALEITAELDETFLAIIAEEVNVKNVSVVSSLSSDSSNAVDEAKTVALNIALTDELRVEGAYRELTRLANDLRKRKGLRPGESASIQYATESALFSEQVIAGMKDQLQKDTSAVWKSADEVAGEHADSITLGTDTITVGIV